MDAPTNRKVNQLSAQFIGTPWHNGHPSNTVQINSIKKAKTVIHLPRSAGLWHAALGDKQALMAAPEWHCEMLRRAADNLLQAGNVSQSDYLDMRDLITGALSHAQEERAAQWYKPNRTYRVALNGREVGQIARGAFKPSVPELIDGLIRYDKRGQLAVFHQYTIYGGEIRGRRWTCTNGQAYALTVIGCTWHGREWRAFDQTDEYRLAIDLAEQAEEDGDSATAALWRERLDACELRPCSTCRSHFALMESCDDCHGTGVVATEAMLKGVDARAIGCVDDSANIPACMNSCRS
ncbi:hypothetical protein ACYTSM_29640 [Pseudomonas aeruginosa]|uniref:hypothetical protein n=1 Tax=Pseudomonas aeruginosa TaxID=287 RepID=UPI0021B03A49|nr:hypothetical protein [Pseudomonas aeruginosa]HCF1730116.1 hypothetical protein [Pseudomonas aeruginosa]HCF4385263.1 hypothetical protein [Pseudomonas aeruginosa]HEK0000127.1 hypothetical protein [Pseudomonas aeruginosa]HEK0034730.1 hypothetical protein [Pseudomonas aeruginosa]